MDKATRDKALQFQWDQKTISKGACDFLTAVFDELFDAMPKAKKMDFIGHANDVFLFINAVKKDAKP